MLLCLCLHSSILLGILYLFFGAFPLVFSTNYSFNLWQTGLKSLGLAIEILLGTCKSPLWQHNYDRLARNRELIGGEKGGCETGFRLPSLMIGAVLVPLGLFWFAWGSSGGTHWIVPVVGSGVFGMGFVVLDLLLLFCSYI